MSDLPKQISLREVGPRDGLQNESPVPTESKGALTGALARAGRARREPPKQTRRREAGPRDGLQNESPVPTESKVALIDALSRTGVGRIEAVSFVHPKAIPSMADAAEVWAGVQRSDDVRYSALVPHLRGARRGAGGR